MLFRFCLYGFLKNQQYFEPFLILAFRDKGLSFTFIGLLFGFREICINLLEIPTGAIADVTGRRNSMIFSHISYILSFFIFGLAQSQFLLFLGMLFFSLGEAFRTGTHKAMIFSWLESTGRQDEKTRIYGLTRSWSKMGSAINVLLAATFVFILKDYGAIFFLSIPPYIINIINFLGYTSVVDGDRKSFHLSAILSALSHTLKVSLKSRSLRRLFFESMGFEGYFKIAKDYLQPVIQSLVLSVPILLAFQSEQRVTIFVGCFYFIMYILSSFASKNANRFEHWVGGPVLASKRLWMFHLTMYGLIVAGVFLGSYGYLLSICGFFGLTITQNFWRPILINRVACHVKSKQMATVLSMESQSKTLGATIAAPVLGVLVDSVAGQFSFLPVGVMGLIICLILLMRFYK